MRNYVFLFLFGTLIMQSEIAYSCEASEKQSHTLDQQGLTVVQQLKDFHRYTAERQEEMRDETHDFRGSFESSRKPIFDKINALKSHKREILDSIWDKYKQVRVDHRAAYTNLKARKVDEFFQNFYKTGAISFECFHKLIESCVLYAKMMHKGIQHHNEICERERDQALDLADINIAKLNIEVSGLEHYGLFTACTPVSQLRTQFVTMYSLLGSALRFIPREILLEAELQEVKTKREGAKVEAENYKGVMSNMAIELQKSCLESNFANMQSITLSVQEISGKLANALTRQEELGRKEGELETQLATLGNAEGVAAENSCFESLLGEVKHCAKLLQLYASEAEVQKLSYKFNALRLQDHEFVTNVLAFRTLTSFQGS